MFSGFSWPISKARAETDSSTQTTSSSPEGRRRLITTMEKRVASDTPRVTAPRVSARSRLACTRWVNLLEHPQRYHLIGHGAGEVAVTTRANPPTRLRTLKSGPRMSEQKTARCEQCGSAGIEGRQPVSPDTRGGLRLTNYGV